MRLCSIQRPATVRPDRIRKTDTPDLVASSFRHDRFTWRFTPHIRFRLCGHNHMPFQGSDSSTLGNKKLLTATPYPGLLA